MNYKRVHVLRFTANDLMVVDHFKSIKSKNNFFDVQFTVERFGKKERNANKHNHSKIELSQIGFLRGFNLFGFDALTPIFPFFAINFELPPLVNASAEV